MKRIVLIALALIPMLAMAQVADSLSMIIRPHDIISPDSSNSSEKEEEDKASEEMGFRHDKIIRYWEIRGTGGLYKSIGQVEDVNAGIKVGGLYHMGENWALGLETGYYHSITKYACRMIPVVAMATYNFENIKYITPFVDVYGGALIGMKVGNVRNGDTSKPNCGIYGGRFGLTYTFREHFHISAALEWLNITDNSNATYGETSVSCLGPSGTLSYTF